MTTKFEGLTMNQLTERNAELHMQIAELQSKVEGLESALSTATESIANAHHVLRVETERSNQLAVENSALINSSARVLQDGLPPHGFYASEWFIAKLKNGEYAALKALPEEYSYDYRTNDGTYYTKDWVIGWMQTPDTEYRPNVKTPATDAELAEIRAQGVDGLSKFLYQRANDLVREGSKKKEVIIIRTAARLADDYAQQLRKEAGL